MKQKIKLPLYEINMKEVVERYDSGDILMLEYLEPFISDDLKDLYISVMEYNEIFANGWTINDLFDMGKEDDYWIGRAERFIKKHKLSKKDYDNYSKYFDEYVSLRDKLLDELGIDDRYLNFDNRLNNISEYGIFEDEIITNLEDIKNDNSYTIARVRCFGYCAELHYYDGEATIEYGRKVNYDSWEDEIEEVDWFNLNMNEEELINKLWELFTEYFQINKELIINNERVIENGKL